MAARPPHTSPSSCSPVSDARDPGSEQKVLLGLIDKLRFARLGGVRLPQVVVVGDQSAGKSSVLGAITGVSFPRGADKCTRFVTEVRLRRARDEGLFVRIVPSPDRTPAERKRFAVFGKVISGQDKIAFEALMKWPLDE